MISFIKLIFYIILICKNYIKNKNPLSIENGFLFIKRQPQRCRYKILMWTLTDKITPYDLF